MKAHVAAILGLLAFPGYRFTGDATHPGIVAEFRRSIATVAALPCDILLSVHPGFSDMHGKLARCAKGPAADPFIDPEDCRAYAADAARRLDRRVADEQPKRP